MLLRVEWSLASMHYVSVLSGDCGTLYMYNNVVQDSQGTRRVDTEWSQ